MGEIFSARAFLLATASRAEVAAAFSRGVSDGSFADVELNEAGQVARLERFAEFYAEQPYPERATEGRRFHLDNPSYGSFDAIMLWSMLREAQPQRILEVGSGFSSAAMLELRLLDPAKVKAVLGAQAQPQRAVDLGNHPAAGRQIAQFVDLLRQQGLNSFL